MRVALRRLRSAVTVFRRMLDCPELQAANAGLKALSARLGPTRDWDVFLGETAPAVSAAFPTEPRLAKLIAAAERRRRECHAALRDFLRSAEFRQLGIALAWLAGARNWHPALPEGADQPVSLPDFAAGVLDRRLRKLAGTDDLDGLETAAAARAAAQGKADALCGGDFRPAVSRQGAAPVHPPPDGGAGCARPAQRPRHG